MRCHLFARPAKCSRVEKFGESLVAAVVVAQLAVTGFTLMLDGQIPSSPRRHGVVVFT